MKLILEVAAAWLALSVPVGVFFGLFAAVGMGTRKH